LKKLMAGSTRYWPDWLPAIQLALNTTMSERHKSSAFALIFGRSFNEFRDFSQTTPLDDLQEATDRRAAFWEHYQRAVLPAVQGVSSLYKKAQRAQADKAHKNRLVEQLSVGDKVMAIDHTKESKWDPVYEGPYTVAAVHRGGNYTLRGADGQNLSRRRTIDMLRLIPSMELGVPSGGAATSSANSAKSTPTLANSNTTSSSDEEDSADEAAHHWEVEEVVNHEWSPQHNQHRFYVKWKGFPSSQNSWVQQKDFDDVAVLKKYWKKANKGATKAVAPWAVVQADAKKALANFSETGKKVWKKKSVSQKEAHEDISGKQEVRKSARIQKKGAGKSTISKKTTNYT
jgi:hypothetical protein